MEYIVNDDTILFYKTYDFSSHSYRLLIAKILRVLKRKTFGQLQKTILATRILLSHKQYY